MHAESLLSTAVSRIRWAASHLVLAFGGSVGVLVVAGLAVGVSDAAVSADVNAIGQALGAALVYIPAVWVLIGCTAALIGLAPRFAAAAWGLLAICFVIAMFGQLLDLPTWLEDVSPFQHVPQLPAADLTVLPLAVLLAVAVGLTAAGAVGLRRRDIG